MRRLCHTSWCALLIALLAFGGAAPAVGAQATPTPPSAEEEAAFEELLGEVRSRPIVFGPLDGELVMEEGVVSFAFSDAEVRDFAMRVEFTNPAAGADHPWDYGVGFRFTEERHFRVGVYAGGGWFLAQNDEAPIQGGPLPPGLLDETVNGTNRIDLIAIGDTGYFALNGTLIAALDLSLNDATGPVAIATSFFAEGFVAGGATGYENFIVWSFDEEEATPEASPTVVSSDATPTTSIFATREPTPDETETPDEETPVATTSNFPTRAATEEPVESPEPAETAVPTDDGYTSPTYGYALEFDASWQILDEDSQDGFDYVRLTNGVSFVDLGGYVSDQTPTDCVDDTVEFFSGTDGYSNVRIATDAENNEIRGELEGGGELALILFTFQAEGGEPVDYVDYIECRPIDGGTAMLRVEHFVPAEQYEDEVAARESLLEGLTIPGDEPPVDETPTEEPPVDETPVDETPSTDPGLGPVGVQLAEQGGSGVNGLATLAEVDGKTEVQLLTIGGAAGMIPLIHRGTCDNLDPTPVYLLQPLGAEGTSTTTINATLRDLRVLNEYVLALHADVTDLTSPVACGEIPTAG